MEKMMSDVYNYHYYFFIRYKKLQTKLPKTIQNGNYYTTLQERPGGAIYHDHLLALDINVNHNIKNRFYNWINHKRIISKETIVFAAVAVLLSLLLLFCPLNFVVL